MEADSSPTARFNEHRLVKLLLVPCARWASKGDQQPLRPLHLSSTCSVDKPVHEELFPSFFSLAGATDHHIAYLLGIEPATKLTAIYGVDVFLAV